MPVVLAIGLDPALVDPKAMGGFSPAVVRAFIDSQLDRVRVAGYEVESCLIDSGRRRKLCLPSSSGSVTLTAC